MTMPEFLPLLDELLELEPGTLKGHEQLESLDDWNSLAVIGFMALVNEHSGKIVSPKEIASATSVADLFALV